MRAVHRHVTVALLLFLPACDGASSRRAVAVGNRPAEEAVSVERGLAMMRPQGGDTPVDRLIVQMQDRVGRDPKKLDSWVRLAHAWIRKARESSDPGFYSNADAAAAFALRLEPGSTLALNVHAMVLLNQHEFEAARTVAEDILRRDSDDVTALGSLSDANLELGRYDEAMAAAQKMVSLKPALPSYSRASYLRWLQGDVDGARKIIRHAIDAAGDAESRAWALCQAAQYFWHEGDHDGALAGYDMALTTRPDYPAALVGKAKIALARGRAPEAVPLFERAYEHSPLVETAWLLGDARQAAGDPTGAAKAYALVETTGATDPRTLALYYATKEKEPQKALALAEEELRRRRDLYTEDAYAWALFRAGKLPEARAASARARRLGTRDARLLQHAGAIELALGKTADGNRLLAEAARLNPGFDRL